MSLGRGATIDYEYGLTWNVEAFSAIEAKTRTTSA